MKQRWEIGLQLTYDITPDDIEYKYEGDAEVDYSSRSLERMREHLNNLLNTTPFQHYHISEMPKRVWD